MGNSDMHKFLSVPVISNLFAENKDAYFKMLKRAKADRVFLYIQIGQINFIESNWEKDLEILRQNLFSLKAKGYDTGVWISGYGMGHDIPKEAAQHAKFTRITDINGITAKSGDAFCPSDGNFTKFMVRRIAALAKAGAEMIMMDDDLCLNVRPGLGCACDIHMRMFNEMTAEKIQRDELEKLVFSGKPNKYRSIWMQLMKNTHLNFCHTVRQAVDNVNPDVQLGFCAGYTSWDLEGATALEMTYALAGKTKPFLRFTSAPYWTATDRFPGKLPCHYVEFARLQQHWCKDEKIEVFAENDSWPRPAYITPSAFIECFDFCTGASGISGQLKYLFDYTSKPEYETAYLDNHVKNLSITDKAYTAGKQLTAAGLYVHEQMHKFENTTLPEKFQTKKYVMTTAFSSAAEFVSGTGIPVTYENYGQVAVAFGHSGKTVPLEGQKGYILDYTAALELKNRGVDVGFKECTPSDIPTCEYFCKFYDTIQLRRTENATLLPAQPDCKAQPFQSVKLSDGALKESEFIGNNGHFPASYSYTNSQGMKFLVFLFDGHGIRHDGDIYRSYYRKKQVTDACKRMGAPLDAVCDKNVNLYLICKKSDRSLVISFCNYSPDRILKPEIKLCGTFNKAVFSGCSGKLSRKRLTLSPIEPYSFGTIILNAGCL